MNCICQVESLGLEIKIGQRYARTSKGFGIVREVTLVEDNLVYTVCIADSQTYSSIIGYVAIYTINEFYRYIETGTYSLIGDPVIPNKLTQICFDRDAPSDDYSDAFDELKRMLGG